MMKKILSYSRVAIPLMLGICIGIALSFMILPLLEESSCEWRNSDSDSTFSYRKSGQLHHFMQGLDIDSFRSTEFEPKVVKSVPSGAQSTSKPVRYRFIKSEIHMRDTFLLAYSTSVEQIGRRATALNKTLNNFNLKFFSDTKLPIQSDLPLVPFNLIDPARLPLLTLKFLANQNSKQPQYKYYIIAPDTTYVKTDAIKDVLLSLDKDEHYLGFSTDSSVSHVCDTSIGFILSQAALNLVGENIARCEQLFDKEDSLASVDKCITSSIKQTCSTLPTSMNRPLLSFPYEDNESLYTEEFKRSLVVSDITSHKDIYSIRRVLAKEEMHATVSRIDEIRRQISDLYNSGSLRSEVPSWAPLVPKAVHTTNRYDIFRWTLVDDNQTFLHYDYDGAQPLKDSAMKNHNEMVTAAMNHINKDGNRYELDEVVHAYSRSDPNRGLDYHLTLKLNDTAEQKQVTKVFEMVKPRTSYQIVRTDFNPHYTPVHVLVPFIGDDHYELDRLMRTFHDLFKDDSHIFLHIVLGHSSKRFEVQLSNKDPFQMTKERINKYAAKMGRRAKVSWIAPNINDVKMVDLIGNAVSKLPDNVIVLTSTLSTIMNTAFISRVRVNTWKHKQIYTPIAFWEYLPDLIYENKPRPSKVDVSRAVGHFGERWYDHISFFSNDYKLSIEENEISFAEPIDVLTSLKGVEILRAVDPDLQVRSHPPVCNARALVDRPKCSLQWLDNIGSGPILAKKLLQEGKIIGKTYD